MKPTPTIALSLLLTAHTAAPAQAPTTPSVPLPARAGWNAEQIHRAETGIWYLRIDKVVDAYGPNEVIAADDQGHLSVLSIYSGNWTAHSCTPDREWLAPTPSVDVDPRIPGREIYAGGRAGSVHRIVLRQEPAARFHLESIEIGHAAGEEFHTVLAADLLPGGEAELLAFGITGRVFRLQPEGADDHFTMRQVAQLPGRVRDAIVVPAGTVGTVEGTPTMLGVSRSGDLLQMRLDATGLQHTVLLHEDCGLGRIAAACTQTGVYYVTRDDGVLLRVDLRGGDGKVERLVIYAGPQGLRGVASGRFFADGREALAVYGYDKTIRMLHRQADGTFELETVFEGEQKGHWLCTGELDGRNGTDELVASGFDGQVVLLSRPAGYGLSGVAVPKANEEPNRKTVPEFVRAMAARAWR